MNILKSSLFILIFLALSCRLEKYPQGKKLYKFYCSNCHMENGSGLAALYPPLANSDFYRNNRNDIACMIRHGKKGKILVNGIEFVQVMEGIPTISEVEITNIVNYINHSWGNELESVTYADIKLQLENCKK